ncbi:MAG: ribosome maturation factor RimM, partial [Pseudomonadota bacterium]|nr:ribosome maturation factor RimM [Pseudomonadota bacterium]
LQSFTSPRDNVLSYQPWFLREPKSEHWRQLDDCEIQNHKDGYLVRLAGVEQREQAQVYSGSLIGVSSEVLGDTEDNEFYWHDLIGCEVVNEQSQILGKVTGLLETGAHDVLQIAKGGESLLIPFVDPYVIDVQIPRRHIKVMWQSDWSE